MTFALTHSTGENFQGPCDLIFSRLLGQLHPRLKGVPFIVCGRAGFSRACQLWTYCPDLVEIGVWGKKKDQAVWAGNMPKEHIAALQAVDISDLVEEEIVDGYSWMPVELPRRLLKAYPGKKDVIADPFMGCAPVGKAVLECGGRFIGYDRNKQHVRFAYEYLACASL